jgi:methane monooxygenase PmoA-like
METLRLNPNALGYEVWAGEHLVTLYRAAEELPRNESPKPCFAPIYTPNGDLVTEYRPADHQWHTGLFFGWVHVNDANLWGGPWYVPERGAYEPVEHTHGIQRHEAFSRLGSDADTVVAEERLTWLDADDQPMAEEIRTCHIRLLAEPCAYVWDIRTTIRPSGERLTLGASRAARYSGLILRLGPLFSGAEHWCSERRQGHEAIMGQRARWVAANGAAGGSVVMMDHPANPRHPVTWFTRSHLLGAGMLMEGDLELVRGASLELRYALLVLAMPPRREQVEALYSDFAAA